jgi:hypothetical protein
MVCKDDLAFLFCEVVQHALEPFLEFATELGARDQRAHVQRQHALVLQTLGHLGVDNALRKAFDDRGFADTGLADQYRVVLGTALQHLDCATYFLVASDNRPRRVR